MEKRPTLPDLAERAFRRRRRQDAALMLPVLGIILLVSPITVIFLGAGMMLGLPVPVLYIFGVWIFLILLAHRLARLLSDHDAGP